MTPKCYISGKVTGTTDYMERFKKAEETVKKLGYEPINPVAVNAALPEETKWIDYMTLSINMLTREDCKAIYMLNGWEDSQGAVIELLLAQGMKHKVLYEEDVDRLLRWKV